MWRVKRAFQFAGSAVLIILSGALSGAVIGAFAVAAVRTYRWLAG